MNEVQSEPAPFVTLAHVGVCIAPRIVNRMKEGGFMRAYTSKGAFTPLLSGIPVRVVMDLQVGLRGALRVAAGAVTVENG